MVGIGPIDQPEPDVETHAARHLGRERPHHGLAQLGIRTIIDLREDPEEYEKRMAESMAAQMRDVMRSEISSAKREWNDYLPAVRMRVPGWVRGEEAA